MNEVVYLVICNHKNVAVYKRLEDAEFFIKKHCKDKKCEICKVPFFTLEPI